MNKTTHLIVGVAILAALSGPSFGEMILPYFEDFESVGYLSPTNAWELAHFGAGPVLTGAEAFSGTVAITDNAGGNVGMSTAEFSQPIDGPNGGISIMFRQGDYGNAGEDDRVRIDAWDGGSYACTLVIWDGKVLNDQDLGQVITDQLQINTWYKVELLFDRKDDNTGYEQDATVNVYNADMTLLATGPLTTGLGSRVIPDQITTFNVSYRGGKGIFVDDIAINVPEPVTVSLLAVGALALLRKRR